MQLKKEIWAAVVVVHVNMVAFSQKVWGPKTSIWVISRIELAVIVMSNNYCVSFACKSSYIK